MIRLKLYGPFYRVTDADKWHWRKECSKFPKKKNPKSLIATTPPEQDSLCSSCLNIEMNSDVKVLDTHVIKY